MTGIVAQNVGRTSGLIKATAGGGAWTLIKTLTASGSADLSFVNGSADVVLDSTYPIYVFHYIEIHPSASGGIQFNFNLSADTGSNYNVTKTTTAFDQYQIEAGGTAWMGYATTRDLAQSTAAQRLVDEIGTDNDNSASGELWLFNPSSTTYVKHFISRSEAMRNYAWQLNIAGYGNTTSAVDAVQFSMSSGNIDAGKVKLYGIGDS